MGNLSMLLALGFASTLLVSSVAGQCDSEARGEPGGLRGSGSGRCGVGTDAHRDPSSQWRQSLSSGDEGDKDLSSLITRCLFDHILKHRNDPVCNASNFYTYDAFLTAAKAFDGFGTTGDLDTRKKELAAFLAQTSHETTGWWATAPDGPFTWGYCLKEDAIKLDFCVRSLEWPCVRGKQYYGRGPMKLYFNYYYGPAGKAIGVDLLSKPELVATDPVISFKTAIWYWMTPHRLKPSCHDVITGAWKPSAADKAAGRLPGYGVITNILRGEYECGHGTDEEAVNRVGFYKAYSDILRVKPGDNLNCDDQIPFGWTERPYLQK